MVKWLSPGGVAERLKAHVLKTCLGHTNVGSNPTPSARLLIRSDSFSNCPRATSRMIEVATTKNWGGARVAEWARLLSECWVKPVAGSNPALPATKKTRSVMDAFFVSIYMNTNQKRLCICKVFFEISEFSLTTLWGYIPQYDEPSC